MAGRRKAVRFAQRVAWTGNAHRAGLLWRDVVRLLATEAVVLAVLAAWPRLFLREAVMGFTIGAIVMAVALAVARFDDPQVKGDLAEQWTAESLGTVRGWLATHNLTFYDGDVDHVVVTPSGVLAVETKYRHGQADAGRRAAREHDDLQAARRAGRRTRNVLRSLGHSVPVTPVLVVWGKGRPTLPEGYRRADDVVVVDGEHPWMWSRLFDAPLVPPATRTAIGAALTDFQYKQIAHAARTQQRRWRECWLSFRDGVCEERAEHALKRARRRNLRRRHAATKRQDPVPMEA